MGRGARGQKQEHWRVSQPHLQVCRLKAKDQGLTTPTRSTDGLGILERRLPTHVQLWVTFCADTQALCVQGALSSSLHPLPVPSGLEPFPWLWDAGMGQGPAPQAPICYLGR